MPDHIHLLIEGNDVSSDMKKCIFSFKQKTGFEFKKKYKNKMWQASYYDHVLRNDEDIKNTAKYIYMNPVRKGLVKSFAEYPFSGSFELDMENLFL